MRYFVPYSLIYNFCVLSPDFVFFKINKLSSSVFDFKNLSRKKNLFLFLCLKLLQVLFTFSFKGFVDLITVDMLGFNIKFKDRFFLFYVLSSFDLKAQILVRTSWGPGKVVESLCSIFKGAGWAEREAYDLFGIVFSNNFDLRRILTDYGFEGFPGLKNFSLSGYKELYFNDELNAITYDALNLNQQYRIFSNKNCWDYNYTHLNSACFVSLSLVCFNFKKKI